ncbi:type III secretion system protein PrgR [Enterococcus faecalis]|uniref:type III secretion system protein PrgR n=1 Tax=Enterococcus faecalis TaxID=1351 RepID=UPI001D16F060|nr:type III secretion system protein PrgR [Enterococcus faecalis]
MKVKAEHLKVFCCEVTLFNRQRWQFFSDGTVRRMIIDFSGKQRAILIKKLRTRREREQFFLQIKSIYFNGKIIANRGCSKQNLMVSNIIFSRMKRRQDLLNQARKAYKAFKKQEKQKWSKQKQNAE